MCFICKRRAFLSLLRSFKQKEMSKQQVFSSLKKPRLWKIKAKSPSFSPTSFTFHLYTGIFLILVHKPSFESYLLSWRMHKYIGQGALLTLKAFLSSPCSMAKQQVKNTESWLTMLRMAIMSHFVPFLLPCNCFNCSLWRLRFSVCLLPEGSFRWLALKSEYSPVSWNGFEEKYLLSLYLKTKF